MHDAHLVHHLQTEGQVPLQEFQMGEGALLETELHSVGADDRSKPIFLMTCGPMRRVENSLEAELEDEATQRVLNFGLLLFALLALLLLLCAIGHTLDDMFADLGSSAMFISLWKNFLLYVILCLRSSFSLKFMFCSFALIFQMAIVSDPINDKDSELL